MAQLSLVLRGVYPKCGITLTGALTICSECYRTIHFLQGNGTFMEGSFSDCPGRAEVGVRGAAWQPDGPIHQHALLWGTQCPSVTLMPPGGLYGKSCSITFEQFLFPFSTGVEQDRILHKSWRESSAAFLRL